MMKMMPINAVESVRMTVTDMDRSIHFYTAVLDCQKVSDCQVSGVDTDRLCGLSDVQMRVVKLQLGDESLELTEFLTPKGKPIPADSCSNDRWFQHIAIVVRDMEKAYQHLQHHWVSQTSPNPQTLPAWNPIAGGIESFYFKDPDGHNLELIHFSADKGDPKWQSSTESLFLGIDRTPIVVADPDISLAFYCDLLGMKLQQESLNFGADREHLSGVSNAQVKINSLKAAAGLGIELLEYIPDSRGMMPLAKPLLGTRRFCGGKRFANALAEPCPWHYETRIDTRPNDVWYCQTMMKFKNSVFNFHQLQSTQSPLNPTKIIPVL